MERKIILLDTSILIEYFRKTNKSKSLLFKLSEQKAYSFAVSAITQFEIYTGSNKTQQEFWKVRSNLNPCLNFTFNVINRDLERNTPRRDLSVVI